VHGPTLGAGQHCGTGLIVAPCEFVGGLRGEVLLVVPESSKLEITRSKVGAKGHQTSIPLPFSIGQRQYLASRRKFRYRTSTQISESRRSYWVPQCSETSMYQFCLPPGRFAQWHDSQHSTLMAVPQVYRRRLGQRSANLREAYLHGLNKTDTNR
jgi:hypothetical protein